MNLKKLTDGIKKPFANLTANAKGLLILRLSTSALIVLLLIFMVGLPYAIHSLYIARLECSHVDVANGLFAALKTSADNIGYANGVGSDSLTTSEVYILGAYTEEQVSEAPQFIYSNLMNWCFGSYNYTSTEDSDGDRLLLEVTNIYNFQCTKTDLDYVFDYRGELSVIGLNIILVYAYGDKYIDLDSDQPQYVPDDAYMDLKARRRLQNKVAHNLLFFAASLNALIAIMTLVYYSKRSYEKNDHKMPMVFRHTFAVASLISWLSITVAVVIITVMTHIIKSRVREELGTFGMSVHMGERWFAVAWLCVGVAFFNLLAWSGPVWWFESNTSKLILESQKLSNQYHDDDNNVDFSNNNRIAHGIEGDDAISMKILNQDELPLVRTNSNGTEIVREDYLTETPLTSNSNGVFIDPYNDSFLPNNLYTGNPNIYNLGDDRYGNFKDMVDYSKRRQTGTIFTDNDRDEHNLRSKSESGLGLTSGDVDDTLFFNRTELPNAHPQRKLHSQSHVSESREGSVSLEPYGNIRDLTRKDSQNSNKMNKDNFTNQNKRTML